MSRFVLVGPIHPLRGGIAQHTAGIVAEARSRGHTVEVYSYRRQYPALLFPGRTQLDSAPCPPETRHGVHAAIDSVAPPSWLRVGASIARLAPDVVALQRWHPFFAPALATIAARARHRSRIVWLVHNARPHEGSIPWGPLLTLGIRADDSCLVHAHAEEHELRRLGVRASVRHVPMPAPAEVPRADGAAVRARLGLASDEVVFLFFGYVRPYKGVEDLVRALSRLSTDGPRWRAVIAGEWYVERQRVENLLEAGGIRDRVAIDDRFLAREEIADYFAASTAVVLPYRSGTQSAVVPLAYAHGRPVVTTLVGGLAEAVRDGVTGLLVAPGDVDALTRALEEIRRGRTFSADAIADAHARASYGPLVDALESPAASEPPGPIVRQTLFP